MGGQELIQWHNVVSALLYSGIGLAIYVVGFIAFDLLTPKIHIWREIVVEKNIALAIVTGAIVIGIALIIAAAVHG